MRSSIAFSVAARRWISSSARRTGSRCSRQARGGDCGRPPAHGRHRTQGQRHDPVGREAEQQDRQRAADQRRSGEQVLAVVHPGDVVGDQHRVRPDRAAQYAQLGVRGGADLETVAGAHRTQLLGRQQRAARTSIRWTPRGPGRERSTTCAPATAVVGTMVRGMPCRRTCVASALAARFADWSSVRYSAHALQHDQQDRAGDDGEGEQGGGEQRQPRAQRLPRPPLPRPAHGARDEAPHVGHRPLRRRGSGDTRRRERSAATGGRTGRRSCAAGSRRRPRRRSRRRRSWRPTRGAGCRPC